VVTVTAPAPPIAAIAPSGATSDTAHLTGVGPVAVEVDVAPHAATRRAAAVTETQAKAEGVERCITGAVELAMFAPWIRTRFWRELVALRVATLY